MSLPLMKMKGISPSIRKLEILNHSKQRWRLILCLLLLFVLQSPAVSETQPEDTLLFREGEILLSKGQPEKALWRFKRLIDDFPQSSLFNEARFRMGVCYTQLKRHKEAIRIFNELLSTFLSPARMIHVLTLLGDNYFELKDPLTALHWYGKGILVPGQPHDDLKAKVRSIIDGLNKEEELNRVESLYRGSYGGGYAKLRLAQIAKRHGNDLLSKKILTEFEKEYGALPKEPSEPTRFPEKPRYPVGVILPLSGPYQPFGERALQAIQLAMRDMERGKSPISLIIRDSKGNPGEAEKAVVELAMKEKVIAILGPVLTVTAGGALKKAQQLKITVMAFSQKEGIDGKSEFVFQNSLTPSGQIRALLEFAMRELNLRTFAVFYPNSPYGLHFRNLFVQEVARRGGKVLGVAAFDEDQTDFGKELKGLFKVEPSGQPRGSTSSPFDLAQDDPSIPRRHPERGPRQGRGPSRGVESLAKKGDQFTAGLSVDGLFIPDTHDRVGPILSQVVYYDIKGLTFLGTNAWNGPGLLSIAGNAAEGAVFVDAFFKKSPSLLVARFVEEFLKAYKREPETLEALCYDGARLLAEIVLSKQVTSSYQLKEELRQVRNYNGITGLKGFGEDGRAIRTLSVLRVNKGQIEQVAGP